MESLKKNQIYRVNIDAYSSDGGGVCRVGGRAVFIPGAIPGEEWNKARQGHGDSRIRAR